ncbi:MAG: TolC family protein, partial [Nitrospinae bacterium]|nr:TolC family protein [Nitrospinota bacterium]
MRTVITLVFLLGSMASADVGHAMTLGQAIETALARNPDLLATDARGEAARYLSRSALSKFGPEVTVSESYVKTDSPLNVFGMRLQRESVTQADFDPARLNNPDSYENWRTTLAVRQPIFAGGQIYYGFKAARSDAHAAESMAQGARSQLVYRVIDAWMALWLADRNVAALEASLELARESMKVTGDREEAGLAHRTDSLDMTINHDRVRQEMNVARAQRQSALERLAALLGLTPEEPLSPGTTICGFSSRGVIRMAK